MMDTYDHRQHQHEHQHQAPYPHYQHHAPNPYQTMSTHPLPIPERLHNAFGTSGISSGPSSFSGSANSSPEGSHLEDLTYTSEPHHPDSASNAHTNPSTHKSSNSYSMPSSHGAATFNANTQSNLNQVSALNLSTAGNSNLQAPMSRTTPLSRPLTHREQDLLAHLDRLKFFLATAPSRWSDSELSSEGEGNGKGANGAGGEKIQRGTPMMPHPNTHPALNRFLLPSGEYVTCVLWSGLYHITGTDIVRALVFRFEAFGRPVRNMKKFEEGIFSDLRNLKPGTDACLEEPKSPFLDLLFKYQCIRTQKKQKVFYWFSVPHDRLFLDALERDLKREKMSMEPTTYVAGEPALSFTYDPKRTLYEQFSKAHGGVEGEGELEAAVRRAEEAQREVQAQGGGRSEETEGGESASANIPLIDQNLDASGRRTSPSSVAATARNGEIEPSTSMEVEGAISTAAARTSGQVSSRSSSVHSVLQAQGSPFFNMFSLFEGSPNYKQRRKKVPKSSSRASVGPGTQGFVRVRDSPDDGQGTGDEAEDNDSDMSAAAMFNVQASLGMNASKSEQARKQVESQRVVQAERLALLQAQQTTLATPSTQPSSSSVLDAQQPPLQQPEQPQPQQQQFPSTTMHPSLSTSTTSTSTAASALASMHAQSRQTLPAISNSHAYNTFQLHSNSLPMTANEQASVSNATNVASFTASNASAAPRRRTPESPRVNGSGTKTTKAFVCPLFSCGRLFKRMEHLKRHLRTHTMEKPYQCDLCQRKFSRSDNLNQHIRIHAKDGVLAAAGVSANLDYTGDADAEEDELEGDDGAEGYGPETGYGSALGLDMDGLDVKMCEVEVGGNMQEIQGDEEGLVTAAKPITGYYTDNGEYYQSIGTAQFAHLITSPDGSPNLAAGAQLHGDPPAVQWAARQEIAGFDQYASSNPSPAYSTISAPSPQQPMPHTAGPSSLNQSTSANANYRMYDYGTSYSAPSHKQAFDQSSLYPQALGLQGLSTGPGPIRRYRSATPSVPRTADNIRRPSSSSASIGDYSVTGAASRGYHPYAMDTNAYTSSTHSSPAPYHAQLEYVQHQAAVEQQSAGSRQGSHSRSNSSHLHEQMRQIINLDQVEGELPYPAAPAASYSDMYHIDPSAQAAAGNGAGSYYSSPENGGSPRAHEQEMYSLVDMGPHDPDHMQQEQWSRGPLP